MEAKNIIFGTLALAVVGGGAYLFLKNKKSKDASKLADLEKLVQPQTATTQTTSTNPSTDLPIPQIKDDPKKIAEAIDLANRIAELKNKKTSYTLMPISQFSKTKEGNYGFFETNQLMLGALKQQALQNIENELKDLTSKITALGYMEVNGSIVKVN